MNTSPAHRTSTTEWLDEFIIELRLREVHGSAIGDAVSQVEGYCAESGESPAEAFGMPREYARSLAFRDDQLDHTTAADVARIVLPSVVGTLGIVLAGQAAIAFTRHQPATLSWGQIAAALLVAALGLLAARMIRALVHHRTGLILLLGGGAAMSTALALGWRTPAATLSWLPMALASVVLLAASVVLMRRNRAAIEDVVIDPVTGTVHRATSSRMSSRAMTRTLEWMFVAAAVLDVILCLTIEHLA